LSRVGVEPSGDAGRSGDRRERLWGRETDLAVANFPVSGRPLPSQVTHAIASVKAAAARVNADLGMLPEEVAGAIIEAAGRIESGELDDQFPSTRSRPARARPPT
jgi:fumarate hydratase class II